MMKNNHSKRRTTFPKYGTGGFLNFIGDSKNTGLLQAGAGIVSNLIPQDNPVGSAASGALSGAASGLAAGPIGALVGGGLGLATGLIGGLFNKGEAERQRKLKNEQIANAAKAQSNQVLSQYDTNGVETQLYAFGGEINGDKLSSGQSLITKRNTTTVVPQKTVSYKGNKSTQDFFKSLENNNSIDTDALKKVWNENGQPDIRTFDINNPSITDRVFGKQPHYNPLSKTISIPTIPAPAYANDKQYQNKIKADRLRTELPHAKQFGTNALPSAYKFATNDVIDYIQGKSPYQDKDALEYEAHSVIQPEIQNSYSNQKAMNYTNSRKQGKFAFGGVPTMRTDSLITRRPQADPRMNGIGTLRLREDKSINPNGTWGYDNAVGYNLNQMKPPVVPSEKALGRSNTFFPSNMMPQGRDIPTQYPSRRFAYGGVPNPDYEVEGGEVVQGQDVNLEGQNQLSNDMTLAVGASHENGGVAGRGGERIYSDRLKVSKPLQAYLTANKIGVKPSSTYADVSNKIGKLKGKMDEKEKSNFSPSFNTARLMKPRLEGLLDNVFAEQEFNKPENKQINKFADGGKPYLKNLTLPDTSIDFGNGAVSQQNPSFLDSVRGFVDNNGDDLINAGSYLANLGTINSLDTSVQRNYLPNPRYNYTDRSGAALNRNSSLLRTGVKSLTNAGQSVNASNIGSLYSQTLNSNSQINQNENLRRDAYNDNYNQRTDRVNYVNNQTANEAFDAQRNINNEKVGLRLDARNALMSGIQTNKAIRAGKELDQQKLLLGLAGADANGVISRLDLNKYKNLLSKFRRNG